MKRFDVNVEGHYPSMEDREYYDDGEFVDANVAVDLLKALEEFANVCDTAPPIEFIQRIGMAYETAKKAIAKAKGESNGN